MLLHESKSKLSTNSPDINWLLICLTGEGLLTQNIEKAKQQGVAKVFYRIAFVGDPVEQHTCHQNS